MASIRQLPSGSWQVQIRRKGRVATETFLRRDHARVWATETETQVDRGKAATSSRARSRKTFADLIALHIEDMTEVGKPPQRSKSATLELLKRELGAWKASELDRERIVKFGRKRAAQGAGPVTLGADIGAIKLVVSHAAAVHGVEVSVEQIDLARIALRRLGLIGKSNERDRRPEEEELTKLLKHFTTNQYFKIPMARVIKFAVATAMRQEEIFKITWSDLNTRTKMVMVHDRKDPRQKKGNNQRIPLLNVSGYDAYALIQEQLTEKKSATTEYFPTTTNRPGPLLQEPVRRSKSRICIFTIFDTKVPAGFLRQDLQFNKWRL